MSDHQLSENQELSVKSETAVTIKEGRGRFPRVFGDEFGDKFAEKYGDSLNLVKTLVTKLVNHQI